MHKCEMYNHNNSYLSATSATSATSSDTKPYISAILKQLQKARLKAPNMFERRYNKQRNQEKNDINIRVIASPQIINDPEAGDQQEILEHRKSERSGIRPKPAFAMIACCGAVSIIASLLVLSGVTSNDATSDTDTFLPATHSFNADHLALKTANKPNSSAPGGSNVCEGTQVPLEHIDCLVIALDDIKPQAGGNVTKGYKGGLQVDFEPITTPFSQNSMCAVNVHWHFGAEHYSLGEYDETGSGPRLYDSIVVDNEHDPNPNRHLVEEKEHVRQGFQCKHYDPTDAKFTKPYDWKHCLGMEVGETYEVHWPHSAAGACGTPHQFQTPFYDGVFCHIEVLDDFSHLQDQIGVQAQVFTVVNDEDYYYPDLMGGMIIDGNYGNYYGQDVVKYTGSTSGTSVNNEICSAYSPITWHVDRKCHLISASSFDKMCADMKAQSDDMSDDLHPHGARELVNSMYVADNQFGRALYWWAYRK
jgi:hypothetical protein